MAFEITVLPSQHTFVAEAGETILNAALRQGVMLPYGCGDGGCGACRGKVVDGQVEHGAAPSRALRSGSRGRRRAVVLRQRAQRSFDRGARTAGAAGGGQDAAGARAEADARRARRDANRTQAAARRASALQARAVHRDPAQGRRAARLSLASTPGDDSCTCNCTFVTCPAGCSPSRFFRP